MKNTVKGAIISKFSVLNLQTMGEDYLIKRKNPQRNKIALTKIVGN